MLISSGEVHEILGGVLNCSLRWLFTMYLVFCFHGHLHSYLVCIRRGDHFWIDLQEEKKGHSSPYRGLTLRYVCFFQSRTPSKPNLATRHDGGARGRGIIGPRPGHPLLSWEGLPAQQGKGEAFDLWGRSSGVRNHEVAKVSHCCKLLGCHQVKRLERVSW